MTDIVHQVEAVSHLTTGGAMCRFLGVVSLCRVATGGEHFIIVGKVPRLSTSGTNCCFFQYSTKHIHKVHNVFYVNSILHKTSLI